MTLNLMLNLDQSRCVRGQSVLFTVTLTNDGDSTIEGIADFLYVNKAVRLLVKSGRGRSWGGLAMGAEARERTAPSTLHWKTSTLKLEPGGTTDLRGDLLWWVGELAPGEYKVTATYNPGGEAVVSPLIRSNQVSLRVASSAPTYVSVPRLPEMPWTAPLTGLWRHGKPEDGKLFFQQQSRVLPPNPYHCFEVANVDPAAHPEPATVALATPTVGHLIWSGKGEVFALEVPMDKPPEAKPWKIEVPVKEPVVLQSPRTTADGSLLALFTAKGYGELHLLEVRNKKSVIAPLDLNGTGPLGQYCVYWTLRDTLELVWARGASRELYYAFLDPEGPKVEFIPRAIGREGGEILRIDFAYDWPRPGEDGEELGAEVFPGRREESVHYDPDIPPPDPRRHLFTLSLETAPPRLVLTRRQLPSGPEQLVGRMKLGSDISGKLQVVDSIMTGRKEPVYLLKDAAGALWYASTEERAVRGLQTLVGEKVTMEQLPSLMAASGVSEIRWVYLRYVSADEGGFKFAKLEPEDLDSTYEMIREDTAITP